LIVIGASALLAQNAEVTARIEGLTSAGNSAAARVVVDSVLRSAAEGSEDYVEALYWHAVLDPTAAGAERNYLRLVVEYPLGSRTSAALLRLAELELARQAKDRARRHLEKLRVDYPQSEQIARAQFLAARIDLDNGATDRACALLTAARAAVSDAEVELRNQIAYLHASCTTAVAPTPRDSAAGSDTSVRRTPRTESNVGRFAIQVAAYNTEREATALVRQLQRRGIAARVVGSSAPFRVRIGRYATREEARRAMTQAGVRGIIVEADPA
jgi:septal ring-binding cell division protein DamX